MFSRSFKKSGVIEMFLEFTFRTATESRVVLVRLNSLAAPVPKPDFCKVCFIYEPINVSHIPFPYSHSSRCSLGLLNQTLHQTSTGLGGVASIHTSNMSLFHGIRAALGAADLSYILFAFLDFVISVSFY